MKKQTEGLTNNIASSRNRFSGKYLPENISCKQQIITLPTVVQVYNGVKVIFVESGSGTLLANGKSYPLKDGICCLLYCYHFHKIVPAPGSTLTLRTCLISYNTFLFLTIVPGYHLGAIEQSLTPVTVSFSDAKKTRIEQIFSTMDQYSRERKPCHTLLLELLGRLCREFAFGEDDTIQ